MSKPINQRFEDMSKLYHFTNLDAATKIIESRRLRFGKMFRMNDLIESNRIVYGRIFSNTLSEREQFAEAELNRYQQISFTQDRKHDGVDYLGFDLHTMWGMYAEKGYGVCLVFDKNKLHFPVGDYSNIVKYENFIPACYEFRNRSRAGIKTEIWRRKEELFFYKRKEWEYEQEYRVIRRAKNKTDDEYLDVSDALSFVIISKDETVEIGESILGGNNYYVLKHLKRMVPILLYKYDLDWYTLYSEEMGDPIWAEQLGYYL